MNLWAAEKGTDAAAGRKDHGEDGRNHDTQNEGHSHLKGIVHNKNGDETDETRQFMGIFDGYIMGNGMFLNEQTYIKKC